MAITGSVDLGDGKQCVTVSHDPSTISTDLLKGDFLIEESTGFYWHKNSDGDNTDVTRFDTGVTGPTGVTGVTGVTGADGVTGVSGVDGVTGVSGVDGVTGVTGVAGVTGDAGVTGVTGDDGVTGVTGDVGVTGVTGVTGDDGVTGVTGIAGDGVTGVTGVTGITGTGITGATGATGPDGGGFFESTISTTDATLTTIDTLALLDDQHCVLIAHFVGVQTNGAGRAFYTRQAAVYRDGAGAANLQGNVLTLFTRETSGQYNATISASGNDILLQVKAAAGQDFDWAVYYQAMSLPEFSSSSA